LITITLPCAKFCYALPSPRASYLPKHVVNKDRIADGAQFSSPKLLDTEKWAVLISGPLTQPKVPSKAGVLGKAQHARAIGSGAQVGLAIVLSNVSIQDSLSLHHDSAPDLLTRWNGPPGRSLRNAVPPPFFNAPASTVPAAHKRCVSLPKLPSNKHAASIQHRSLSAA